MKSIYLIIVLLVLTIALFAAEYNITGSVRDSETGQPLIGANLKVVGLPIGAATDLAGNYVLSFESDEQPSIIVSYIGYSSTTMSVQGRKRIPVELDPISETLDAVNVTGVRKGKYSGSEGMSYSSDALKDRREQGLTSMGEMLDGLSGVHLDVCCALDNRTSLSLLGLPGEYTEITVDGSPEVAGLASSYRLYSYPAIGIERIDVKKGAASVKSESKSLGGHIDIVTRRPGQGSPEGSVGIYQRSVGGTELQTEMTGRTGSFGTQFAFSFLRADMFDRNDDGWSESPKTERMFSRVKVFLGEEDSRYLNIAGLYIDEEVTGGMTDVTRAEIGQQPNWVRSVFSDRWEMNADAGLPLGNGVIRANLTGAYVNLDQIVDTTETVIYEKGYVLSTGYDSELLGNDFDVEVRYRFETTDAATESSLDIENDRLSLAMSRDFELGNETSLTAGVRADGDDAGDGREWKVNPRLSFESMITPFFKLQARAGTGGRFRPSSQDLLSGYDRSVIVRLPGTLKSEQGITGNLAAEYKLFVGSTIVTLDATGYYTNIDRRILPVSDDDGVLTYVNADEKTTIFGGETNVQFDISNGPLIHLGLDGTRTDYHGGELPFIPRWRGFGRLTWDDLGGVDGLKFFSITMLYGPQVLPANTYGKGLSESFTTTTLGVSKKFGALQFCLSVMNVFDETQDISPLQGTSDPFATGVSSELVYGPLVGRAFSASMVIRFEDMFSNKMDMDMSKEMNHDQNHPAGHSGSAAMQSDMNSMSMTHGSDPAGHSESDNNAALRRDMPTGETKAHPPGCPHAPKPSEPDPSSGLKREMPSEEVESHPADCPHAPATSDHESMMPENHTMTEHPEGCPHASATTEADHSTHMDGMPVDAGGAHPVGCPNAEKAAEMRPVEKGIQAAHPACYPHAEASAISDKTDDTKGSVNPCPMASMPGHSCSEPKKHSEAVKATGCSHSTTGETLSSPCCGTGNTAEESSVKTDRKTCH